MLEVTVVLAEIMLAKIPALVGYFTRILFPDGTLTSEENKTWDGTEYQPRTDMKLSDGGTLTRIPISAGTLKPPDISTSEATEHQPQTELKLLAAECSRDQGSGTRGGSGRYMRSQRNKSHIKHIGLESGMKFDVGSPPEYS